MKTPINTILIVACTALASPVSPDAHAQAICGDLGVMTVDPAQLPPGATLADVRMCTNHPWGRNRTLDPQEGASLALWGDDHQPPSPDTTPIPPINLFEKKSCYLAAPYGCSRGYCWKSCGDKKKGEWCWTAGLGGTGHWAKCNSYQQCGTNSVNFGCGKGPACPSCGCGC